MKARRIPARAALVLGVGVLSSLGLVVAGFLDHGDPALAGRATLGRVADNAADEVVTRWERLRRDPTPFGSALAWTLAPAPAPRPALDLPARPERVLDALLGEATRLERVERDPARALEVLASVLEKPVEVTGPVRRAEARLRAIQIALAAAEPATAHEHWSRAWDELEPRLARGETSYLLLCTLAAAPSLTPEERTSARARLAALWDAGELALPPEDAPTGDLALHLGEPAPEAAELLRRLQALVPDAPEASLERLPLAARARAVAAAFGALEPPAEDGRARLAPSADGAHELLYRRSAPDTAPDTAEGVLRPAGATAAALEAGLRADGLLPEEFALDFAGDAAGTAVHERTPLPGSALAFTLRHADPERYASAFARRQTLLRAALFVLAALTAAAGISTFRALLRERALAELKSTFVANVSHELRTPIASILLLSENLERDRVEGEAARRRYHGLIRREAERLRALVDDVLDTARLERGEALHLVRAALPAAELARALEQAARERVAAAEGTLAFSARDLPEHVHVDPEALRRALLNLVENALRHSGSTDLDLSLTGDGRGGLVLGLRDHGRGVPAAARERLFQPFARLEHADAVPGTGLGLAIVREIALGHGGSVRVRGPDDGPGALFELLLPAEGGP